MTTDAAPDGSAASKTREALTSLAAAVRVLTQGRLPEMAGSARAVEQLGATERVPKPLDEAHLDRARRDIIRAIRAGDVMQASLASLREAPWLMWSEKTPLAALPGLLDAVVHLATSLGSVRRKLIEAWLLGFASNAPGIEDGGLAIRTLLAANADARQDLWRRADLAFSLFDAGHGPGRVAAEVLTAPRPVEDVLRAAGLDNPAQAGGGYARAVQAEVLARFAKALRARNGEGTLARCVSFLTIDNGLRFSDAASRGSVARSLLSPWLDGGRAPAEPLRIEIQGFLLRMLGDPRIRPQGWTTAGAEATALMRRWLDLASFEAFFELIGEYSPEEQFEYRKAFWSAYLERRAISRIWIALGGQVHSSARAVRELNGAYGRLSGAAGTDAVLLMQAGDVVLCEWSRIGALRAWKPTARNAPKLDLTDYLASELRGSGLDFPPGRYWSGSSVQPKLRATTDGRGLSHIGPERGYWQTSAAEFMAKHTGLRLGPDEWMPR